MIGSGEQTAILLIGHGSAHAEVKTAFCALAELVRNLGDGQLVEVAFLSHGEPDIADGIDRCVAQGARRVVLCPYFLFAGSHVRSDLPAAMAANRRRHPQVDLLLAEPLGVHGKLAEVVCERVAQALSGLDGPQLDR